MLVTVHIKFSNQMESNTNATIKPQGKRPRGVEYYKAKQARRMARISLNTDNLVAVRISQWKHTYS